MQSQQEGTNKRGKSSQATYTMLDSYLTSANQQKVL